MCACFFVDCSSWFFVHLETYIHESVNLSPWYPRSLPTIFPIFFWFLMVLVKLDLWVLGLLWLHLHALISRERFWTQVCLDKRIDSYQYSLYLVCVLNDIEEVRIPCLCILYSNAKILIYARTLGSFLISFRALFLSYHDIFFCPIGSLDLLIACFIRWSFFTLLSFCNLRSSI